MCKSQIFSYPAVEHVDVNAAVANGFNKKQSFKRERICPLIWLSFELISVVRPILIQVVGSSDENDTEDDGEDQTEANRRKKGNNDVTGQELLEQMNICLILEIRFTFWTCFLVMQTRIRRTAQMNILPMVNKIVSQRLSVVISKVFKALKQKYISSKVSKIYYKCLHKGLEF